MKIGRWRQHRSAGHAGTHAQVGKSADPGVVTDHLVGVDEGAASDVRFGADHCTFHHRQAPCRQPAGRVIQRPANAAATSALTSSAGRYSGTSLRTWRSMASTSLLSQACRNEANILPCNAGSIGRSRADRMR